METYEFIDEQTGFNFKIEATDYEDAYVKAYDIHGPQVDDMFYKIQKP